MTRRLIKKLHMYIGLLNFCNILVFGIAGLAATFHWGQGRKPAFIAPVRYENFTAPPGLTDKQIADQIFNKLHLPLTGPVSAWDVHRDADGNMPLDFYTAAGIHRVVYLPKENRLKIEDTRSSLWFFLDDVHTVTDLDQLDWRMRWWAYYNNFALWSLSGMAISGTYLWLSSRLGYRIARYSFAGGTAVFIALYILTR
ncbi:MAG: hypothetical protein DMG57_07880 [Acidobacteria bacterium]|nr:MAG: hypothetical protein DMG57_07880 [Acidobacteriota bacterium]